MERYLVIKEVGFGTFGNVWRAVNKESGEIVAIKKMKKKYYCWEDCMNLREVKSLQKMNHPNIVKLKEIIKEHNVLYFVFEYMECNFYQFMKDRDKPFLESEIRSWCFQVFQALAYMHQQDYFHRDLKPENLLVSKGVIKVADFGLAREISSSPLFTEYVSTRWYRAPEVLLQSSVYGPAVDLWAMGAIMAELFNLRPLFPGTNEADEIYKICCVIGSPCHNTWAEGLHLAETMKFQFPQYPGIHLSMLIPSASEFAISLISSLCSWDPLRRPTAAKALQHPFFKPCYYIPPSLRLHDTGASKTPPSSVGVVSNSKIVKSQDHVPYKNCSVQPLYRQPSRINPGHLGRVANGHKSWDFNENLLHPVLSSGRIDDMAEKMAKLTMNSGSQVLKSGNWHSKTRYLNRSYKIPPARFYLSAEETPHLCSNVACLAVSGIWCSNK